MLGFLFGSACLYGFVRVARSGRGRHGRFTSRRGWVLRRLFERLDTSHGQEKVLLSVAEQTEREVDAVRGELHRARLELAQALRAEAWDPEVAAQAFGRVQTSVEAVRRGLEEGARRLHETLEPGQRRELADLLEHGPRHGHCRGARGGGWSRRHEGRSGVVSL